MKNKKILIIIILLIILALIFIFLKKYNKNQPISLSIIGNNISKECSIDSDCDFWTKGIENEGGPSCHPCSASDDLVVCVNKDLIKVKTEEYFKRKILCERCLDSDYDLFSCRCVDNKCIKQKR